MSGKRNAAAPAIAIVRIIVLVPLETPRKVKREKMKLAAIETAQLRLFDFSGGIPGDGGKDDPPRAFIAGERLAEIHDFRLGAGNARQEFDHRRGNFAQPRVGQADDGHIPDFRVSG